MAVSVISVLESSSFTMDGFPKAKKLKEDIDSEEKTKESSIYIQNSMKSSDPSQCEVTPQVTSPINPESGGNQISPNKRLSPSISDELLAIEERLCAQLLEIKFPSPVTHVYNPLSYASQTHQNFVRRFGNGKKKILFVGMNPGPFGMAQNGVRKAENKMICVSKSFAMNTNTHTHTHALYTTFQVPFGDTTMVKEFLCISGVVGSPANEHPKRAIQGLDCTKNEVSGTRFWNLIRELCSSPEVFFKNCFVHNYCPLCFMAASGKNITPPMLRTLERRHLEEICNQSLVEVLSLLEVEFVVGVGKYAEERAKAALLTTRGLPIRRQEQLSIGKNASNLKIQTETSSTGSTDYVVQESSRRTGNSISPTLLAQSEVHNTQDRSKELNLVLVSSDRSRKDIAGQTASEPIPNLLPPTSGCHGNIKVYGLMHPSPINPAANKGWNQLATAKFSELGLLEIIKGGK